jgi:hypothetical protein
MDIRVYRPLHMQDYYDESNPFWKDLHTRIELFQDPTWEAKETVLQVYFPDQVIANERIPGTTEFQVTGKNEHGHIKTVWGLKQAEVDARKEYTKYLFLANTPFITLQYRGQKPLETALILPSVFHEVLKRNLPNCEVTTNNNDHICNGNKIASHDTNLQGLESLFQCNSVNDIVDPALFSLYMTDEDRRNNKQRGITGIRNENPAFTIDTFTNEVLTGFRRAYEALHPGELVTLRSIERGNL